jgi:hypothetical protein
MKSRNFISSPKLNLGWSDGMFEEKITELPVPLSVSISFVDKNMVEALKGIRHKNFLSFIEQMPVFFILSG